MIGRNPAPDAAPSPITTGEIFQLRISASDRWTPQQKDTRPMADQRSLSEIANRQMMDWDRYAGSLRREVAKLTSSHPSVGTVAMCCDHISLLLDEIDLLRSDIRRAYDIANEYLNETIELRGAVATDLTRLQNLADAGHKGVDLGALSDEDLDQWVAAIAAGTQSAETNEKRDAV